MEYKKITLSLVTIFLIATVAAQSDDVQKILDEILDCKTAALEIVSNASKYIDDLKLYAKDSATSMKQDATSIVYIKHTEWMSNLNLLISEAEGQGINVTDCIPLANYVDETCNTLMYNVTTVFDKLIGEVEGVFSYEEELLKGTAGTASFLYSLLECDSNVVCLGKLSDAIANYTMELPPLMQKVTESSRNMTSKFIEDGVKYELKLSYLYMADLKQVYLECVSCIVKHA